jgi:Tfp pilus assembly PilM family ATPase
LPRDEISSTEKLLDLIRSSTKTDNEFPNITPSRSFPQRIKSYFSNLFSFKKSITVGVDIGYSELKLVKTSQSSPQKQQLLDYVKVPYLPNVSVNDPEFIPYLKSVLTRLCGFAKRVEIWANISSARVEMRYLRIPKVPQKQITNAVYWSFKKITSFNEKDTTFDFEVLGDMQEGSAQKIEVMAYTAPTHEIKKLKGIFSKSGFPLKGISIVPFAFQNLLLNNWVGADAKNISSLYIGRDWSRIDIFSNGYLVLSRGIKAGIKTMRATITGEKDENRMELSSKPVDPDEAEKTEINADRAQKIFFDFPQDSSLPDTRPAELKHDEKEIFQMILPALKRLVRQVELTFEHFSANFENESVERIYISSSARPHKFIVEYIGNELGIPKENFDPFSIGSDFSGEVSGPESALEREAFTPATGIAISNNSITPNFLFTYEDKKKVADIHFINKILYAGFALIMILCVGFYFYQGNTIREKKDQMAMLKLEMSSFRSQVNQVSILKLVDEAKSNNEAFKEYGRKYLVIAALSEIAELTPTNIRLLNISAQLEAPPGAQKENPEKSIVIGGIILGNRMAMESILARYLLALKGSPIFDQPVISEKTSGFFNNNEVLQFTTHLKLIPKKNGTNKTI